MYNEYGEIAIKAAREAGKAIMAIYQSEDFNIQIKEDDSPLTKADREAHDIIINYLKKTSLPILSEEGASIPYEVRKNWKLFWMVDPLDGTKEFIKRNGEFTVNIALIENGIPVFGVVYAPVLDKLYYGGEGMGTFLQYNNETTKLEKQQNTTEKVRIVASRSHLNKDTRDFIDQFKNSEMVPMGSSLKFMVLAEGKADYYPRFAPTMEWDTAAAHAIVKAVGYQVIEPNLKKPLVYNKENLLNPCFLVE